MEKIDWTRVDGHALLVLKTVVQSGSMAAASRMLDINQSTISHTIDKLRRALNDPLFIRVGRRIEPTGYLRHLLPRVDVLLTDLATLSKIKKFDPKVDISEVTIATNVTEMIPQLLALRDRLQLHGNVRKLRLLELGSRDRMADLLESEDVDLVISVRSPKLPVVLERRPLLTNDFAVFFDKTQRKAPGTMREYLDANHAVLDFGGKTPSTIDTILAKMNAHRKVTLGVSNVHALSAFVTGTDYICTMQAGLAQSTLMGLSHCPVPFALDQVHFDLVWHRRNSVEPKNIWLRDTVEKVYLT